MPQTESKSKARWTEPKPPTPMMVNLTRARESRGLTQVEMAQVLGLRTYTYRLLEAGEETRVYPATWKRLCAFLGYFDIYTFITHELAFKQVPRPCLVSEFNHFDL